MKSYTKRLMTKRELCEILIRPIMIPGNESVKEKVIENMMIKSKNKDIINNVSKTLKWDIVPFINNTFLIREEII